MGSLTIPLLSLTLIWLCTSATFFWNCRNISEVSIGWMKIEISKTLSRLIIGENQLSVKYRGYEIIKNVRAIFSPRFIDFGSILRADGAMISCNSKLAD